jgi:hypothetical protein
MHRVLSVDYAGIVTFNSQRPLPGFLEWQIGQPFGGWCKNQMEEING